MIFELDSTDLRLVDAAHPFAERHRAAIAANWRQAVAAQPRLWNGPHFLFSAVKVEAGVLVGTAHRADFATFLYWRERGRDDPGALHVTGTSLPVAADGALLAVRMAGHTANAGQLYFPAGSLDPADIVEGRVDVSANIRRELDEETGLRPPPECFDAGYVAAFVNNGWHVARRCRLAMTFGECAAHVRAHQARTGDDEIDALIAVRDGTDAAALRDYARELAQWHFAEPKKGDDDEPRLRHL